MAVWKARAVHLFTASGAVAGFLTLTAIVRGAWLEALAWMGVSAFIDGIDGALARRYDVRRFTPNYDGALLDNIVDYFTYAAVPAFFLYESGLVPVAWGLVLAAAILLASAYQFCQVDAKTADHYFKGFPCYWNVLAFYLFFLGWPPWANVAAVLILSAAVFVPIKYLYPSRTPLLRGATLALGGVWAAMIVLALAQYPETGTVWVYLSLGYVAYYFAASFYLTFARSLPADSGPP